jgi:hypothetical protein
MGGLDQATQYGHAAIPHTRSPAYRLRAATGAGGQHFSQYTVSFCKHPMPATLTRLPLSCPHFVLLNWSPIR